MSQNIINTGQAANDGTGEPLRQAFTDINNNFSQIWSSGPVNSNVQITNNKIATLQTNQNLILAPNGIGAVQANTNIIPNTDHLRDLGSNTNRWDTMWGYNVNTQSLSVSGSATITGNLTVSGNIIEMGNIVTDTKTIQLSNTASNANSADGSGLTVGANDDIATLLYSSSSNTWTTNIGISTGNIIIQGDDIYDLVGPRISNGDLSHGATAGLDISTNGSSNATLLFNTYGNIQLQTSSTGANVYNYEFGSNGNVSFPGNIGANGNIQGQYFLGNGRYLVGLPDGYNNQDAANFLANLGTNAVSTLGNVTAGYFFGDGSQLTGINKIINGTSNVDIPVANGNVQINADANAWTFDNTGTLTLPGNNASIISDFFGTTAFKTVANAGAAVVGEGSAGAAFLTWANDYSDLGNADIATVAVNFPASPGNVQIFTGNNSTSIVHYWSFGNSGQTVFPTLSTARGDNPSGNITGSTLNFGDGSQEAVITTPNGVEGIDDSQRLVINPGKGRDGTAGEGGDIYLWAGRGGSGDAGNAISGGSGGDIKIRGGQGGGGIDATGDGGYIRIEGGDSSALGGSAGYIEISGGVSQDLTGGYVNVSGGQGVTGADANLTGGVGTAGSGGAVRLTGGTSANGLPEYGNIYVQSGINTWVFDNTGNLIINHGSQITEVASPVPGNYALALSGTGVIDPDQQLLIYPTSLDANHLHLTSGNLYNTELFLGNDNLYVKLANTGNIVVNTNDNVGNTAQWNFDASGNLTAPGNVVASTFVSNEFNVLTAGNLSITSQYGLGFTGTILEQDGTLELLANGTGGCVVVGWDSSYGNGLGNIAAVRFNQVGGGEGNVIVCTGNRAGTEYNWNFDSTGNLTIPGTMIVTGGIVGSGASPAPSLSGFDSLSAISITATGTGTAINAASGNITTNEVTGTRFNFLNGAYTATLTGSGATSTYTLNLPANAGSNGQILTTDGTGNLNWTTAASGYGNANVANFLDNYGSNTIVTTGNITGGNINATANIIGSGYARLSGTFDESQASTAGLYLGYAGGTPRMMFGTGNTQQTLEIDNDGGTLRFYKPGTTLASLTNSGVFSAAGNITGANILANSNLSVVGNIIANNFTGYGNIIFNQTLSTQGGSDMSLIPGTGLVRSLGNLRPYFANTYDLGGSTTRWNNIYANVNNSITETVTGNITGGNVLTGGLISATGNVTGGNIRTTGLISATGSITTGSNVSAVDISLSGGAWTTYTPSWQAFNIAPNIGNGTLTGRYKQLGKTVQVFISFTAGSTTTFGDGFWVFSLPVTARSTNNVILTGQFTDSGSYYEGVATNLVYPVNNAVSPYYNGAPVTALAPTTWTSGAVLVFSGTYEAA